MRISVIIPAYNAARTIRMTLDSALAQTRPADEILVMDDGSTDETPQILESYGASVRALRQENKGVAAARNELCARATGDLIAFLDSDDLWHPCYLERQTRLLTAYPHAVACFAGATRFRGYGEYEWKIRDFDPAPGDADIEVLDPLAFSKRLDTTPARFVVPGLICVRKMLSEIGRELFCESVSAGGVSAGEDYYLFRRLALLGDVIKTSTILVAYRFTHGSLSEDSLNCCRLMIEVYRVLEEYYRPRRGENLYEAFRMSFASDVRQYAKRLMGAGMAREARSQIRLSLSITNHPLSIGNSLGFLLVSYLPAAFQPKWPSPKRVWPSDDGASPNQVFHQ